MIRSALAIGALASAMTVLASAPAAAEVTFAGKTISFIMPFGVGGGTDLWGRFNAPFLGKYLPGKPVVVVKNIAGGGSITGANMFAATAKPDGLTILGSSASTQFPYLLGEKQVKYDYRDWKMVLVAPTGGVAYIAAKLGVKSVADLGTLRNQKLFYASQGPSSLDMVPVLAFRLLGLEVQPVFGFPSRGEGRLGFERGEYPIDFQTTTAYRSSVLPLVKTGEALPLFSLGVLDEAGELARDPNFPDLPHFGEAYAILQGKKPAGIEWEALRSFLLAGFPAQKLIVLPKDTPDEIVEAYRDAVRKMRQDKDYLASRDEMIGEYEQVTDAAGERLYRIATTISPAARAWVRDFLAKNYQVEFE